MAKGSALNRCRQQFRDCPGVIGQFGGLRWCLVVGRMNPAEVEVGDLQGQRKAMISHDFAVPERLSCEPAIEQADV